jgi:hypothetical protein
LKLSVVGLQRLDDPADTEFKVALGAVESPDNQVDDTQMETLLVGL